MQSLAPDIQTETIPRGDLCSTLSTKGKCWQQSPMSAAAQTQGSEARAWSDSKQQTGCPNGTRPFSQEQKADGREQSGEAPGKRGAHVGKSRRELVARLSRRGDQRAPMPLPCPYGFNVGIPQPHVSGHLLPSRRCCSGNIMVAAHSGVLPGVPIFLLLSPKPELPSTPGLQHQALPIMVDSS